MDRTPVHIPCDQRSSSSPLPQTRIALYSHDTMGLGHMRRNILLAQTLGVSPLNAISLIVAGAREAAAFTMPPGVDCLTLPALSKDGNGRYGSRHMPIGLQELVTLRAGAIHAALEAFQPDVLIVDNVPRGAMRELDSTLRMLRAHARTRLVLGLRDVLDDPRVVRAEWRRDANEETIRDYYDAIWVYGDEQVCDPRVVDGLCRVPALRSPTTAPTWSHSRRLARRSSRPTRAAITRRFGGRRSAPLSCPARRRCSSTPPTATAPARHRGRGADTSAETPWRRPAVRFVEIGGEEVARLVQEQGRLSKRRG